MNGLVQRVIISIKHALPLRCQSHHLISELLHPLILAMVMLFAPYDAPPGTKPYIAALLLLLAISSAYIDARFSEATRHSVATALQCITAIVIAFIAPQLWHIAVIAVVGVCGPQMSTEFRQYRWQLVTASFGALAAIALLTDQPPVNWVIALVVAALVLVGAAIWFEEVTRSRQAFIESHKQLLDRALAFSWEIDRTTHRICSVAGNVKGVLGYEPAELVGQHFSRFTGQFESGRVWVEGNEQHAVVTATHRNGSDVVLHEVRFPQSDDNTIRGVSCDVTEANQAIDALRYQAEHDSLTGLMNRTALRKKAELALHDTASSTALLIVDFDRFKEVNDTLGHQTGDQLLQVIGRRFQGALGKYNSVARIGGDEFAFLLTGTNQHTAAATANKIAKIAGEAAHIDGFALSTSASIGIALSPDHATTYEELLKCADIACYSAKQAGGGVQFFESVPAQMSRRRLKLLTEMPSAIKTGQFELHLQPQVSISNGAIVGAEGLARWRHPELGLLYPGDFLHTIDLASDYQRFTNEMIRQAISFVSTASARGKALPVAVNLGTMSLRDESLPARVKTMLEQAGVDGSLLTFEVIETDLVPNDPFQQQVFRSLAALGIRISIDDFGTGYSNFSQLKSLTVDEVKIDRSFIQGLGESHTDLVIVESMINLTGKLGYTVVAEGVEHKSQAQILSDLGCNIAQGYYYARPMPQAALLTQLGDNTTAKASKHAFTADA